MPRYRGQHLACLYFPISIIILLYQLSSLLADAPLARGKLALGGDIICRNSAVRCQCLSHVVLPYSSKVKFIINKLGLTVKLLDIVGVTCLPKNLNIIAQRELLINMFANKSQPFCEVSFFKR
jgi:hypothetical protein